MVISSKRVKVPLRVNFVNYIQSSGTQYIDTEIVGKSGITVEMELAITDVSLGAVLASYSSAGRFYPVLVETGAFKLGYGAMQTVSGITVVAGKKYSVRSELLKGSQKFSVDGTEYYSGSNSTEYDTGLSMLLFANHYSATQAIDHAKARLYSCHIFNNGTLARDFRPCLDENGAVCLYDMVSETYFYNAGSGEFTAG